VIGEKGDRNGPSSSWWLLEVASAWSSVVLLLDEEANDVPGSGLIGSGADCSDLVSPSDAALDERPADAVLLSSAASANRDTSSKLSMVEYQS
jgi:hypothetical protein